MELAADLDRGIWLEVPQFEMARAAFHEDEQARLGPWPGAVAGLEERRQVQAAHGQAADAEELAPGGARTEMRRSAGKRKHGKIASRSKLAMRLSLPECRRPLQPSAVAEKSHERRNALLLILGQKLQEPWAKR
jgi:hypothetical protein